MFFESKFDTTYVTKRVYQSYSAIFWYLKFYVNFGNQPS